MVSLLYPVDGGKNSKYIALTFDDLPSVNSIDNSLATRYEIVKRLSGKLKANNLPATGFVNEVNLYVNGKPDKGLVNLLDIWLDAGIDLGNHTFSHADYNTTPFKEFTDNIRKGDIISKAVMKQHGKKLKYFRYPFLHTGKSPKDRLMLEEFLKNNGYVIAPVTVDNSDWIFAAAYDKALAAKDSALAKQIADAFIPYMEKKFDFYESCSDSLFGRQIKQIILLHANKLNADNITRLTDMLKNRGYSFISVAEALKDTAYKSKDTYYKGGGISWMDRWALTRGKRGAFFKGDPATPEFVMKAAGVTEE